jgi:hypothetical protein
VTRCLRARLLDQPTSDARIANEPVASAGPSFTPSTQAAASAWQEQLGSDPDALDNAGTSWHDR